MVRRPKGDDIKTWQTFSVSVRLDVSLCTKWEGIDAIKFFTDYLLENTLYKHLSTY